jgi:chromosome segregation ATPase
MEENEKKPMFDFRNLVIGGLIIFCIWIYFNPFNGDKISGLEKDIFEKNKKIDKIEFERDSLKLERLVLDGQLKKLKEISKLRNDTINILLSSSRRKDGEIKTLRNSLKSFKDFLSDQEKKIDELEKNPIVLPKNKLLEKTAEKLK